MAESLRRMQLADQCGLDFYGVGEHHRQDFLDSAPVVILAAGGRADSADSAYQCGDGAERGRPDLISQGRAEMVKVGVHAFRYVAAESAQAADEFYPGYTRMVETLGKEREMSPLPLWPSTVQPGRITERLSTVLWSYTSTRQQHGGKAGSGLLAHKQALRGHSRR
jgi:hypothetical protein